MNNETARQAVISELQNLYVANGFITEDEALACFATYKIPLSEIDSISEHLLGLGILIRIDDDKDEGDDFTDRSKLDYDAVFNEMLKISPGLETFIDYVRSIVPPQNREWKKLIPQIQGGNKYAQNRLIEMYLRIVIRQALYYCKRFKLPLEDTIQDGVVGIMLAVKKFDPTAHEKFSTYAPWWINQNICRSRWVQSNPMYFPVHIKDTLFQIQESVDEHICEECHENDLKVCPSLCAEIGGKYEMSADEAGVLVFYLKQCSSIDNLGEDEPTAFSDYGAHSEEILEKANTSEMFNMVRESMAQFKERERFVLSLRFGLDDDYERSLEETGRELNITRERVRQIEAKVLRRLRIIFGIKESDEKQEKG